MKRIIISVVCYNNENEIIEFANSLQVQSCRERILLIITCNSVNDYDAFRSDVERVPIRTEIFFSRDNLGYLNGCFYGLSKVEITDDDWVVICNTDIDISNHKYFEYIISNKFKSDIGGIAPNIQLIDGTKQNPFLIQRPSKKKIKFWTIIHGNPYLYVLYTELSRLKKNVSNQKCCDLCEIYAFHGSFMIIKGDVLKSILKVDNEIVMYGEELFIAEIMRQLGKKILFVPDLSIMHKENSTTKLINIRKKTIWYKQSYRYLYNSFFVHT